MDFLLDALTDWLKEMLVGGIMSNLSGMFDSVNQQVADVASQVGTSPAGFSPGVFSMIRNVRDIRKKDFSCSLRAELPVYQVRSCGICPENPHKFPIRIMFPDRAVQTIFLHKPSDLFRIHHDPHAAQPHADTTAAFTIASESIRLLYLPEIFIVFFLPFFTVAGSNGTPPVIAGSGHSGQTAQILNGKRSSGRGRIVYQTVGVPDRKDYLGRRKR